jgi:hypothetical protein
MGTVPDMNQIFAASQIQLLSQVWRGPGVPSVLKERKVYVSFPEYENMIFSYSEGCNVTSN